MKEEQSIIGSILILFCAVASVNSYSKYGRGCADIGCAPRETCVLVQDSCNYGQREGKECGSYPTCKRSSSTEARPGGSSLSPAPENTFFSPPSNPTLNTNTNNQNNNKNTNQYPQQNTNMIFGSPQNQPPQINSNIPIFPYQQPTSPPGFQQFPQAQHPGSVPHIQPNLPGAAPPYIFGNQPSYFSPQATTREPSLFEQFLYNKQDRPRHNTNSSYRAQDFANAKFLTVFSLALVLIIRNAYAQ